MYINKKNINQKRSNNNIEQKIRGKHEEFNNNDYDLLLSSIYIISELTNLKFNEIVENLKLGDIIYNENY